jgi:2-phosphosulfolactate phosphatase
MSCTGISGDVGGDGQPQPTVAEPTTGLTGDDAAQHGFAYRFEWGADGVAALAPHCDVIVIVDVLRFSSAVSVAIDRGATVFPHRWNDASAPALAEANGAVLAGRRGDGPISLSPTDLGSLPAAGRIVLPSPNGSTLVCAAVAAAGEAGVPFVLVGSLRNATATARQAQLLANGGAIGVIAAGEQWPDGGHPGRLRACTEDLLGAGAILAALDPSASFSQPGCSPEAAAARAGFVAAKPLIDRVIADTASARELARRGSADDVATSSRLDVSDTPAQWCGGAIVRAGRLQIG